MADINNHSGTVLGSRQVSAESEGSGPGQVPEQKDEHLGLALDVLTRLHARFYPPEGGDDDKRSVPIILRDMRRSVFPSPRPRFVFSGLIPQFQQKSIALSGGPRLPIMR